MELHFTKNWARRIAALLLLAAAAALLTQIWTEAPAGVEEEYNTAFSQEEDICVVPGETGFILRQPVEFSADKLELLYVGVYTPASYEGETMTVSLYDASGECVWRGDAEGEIDSGTELQRVRVKLRVEAGIPYEVVVSDRAPSASFEPREVLEKYATDCLTGEDNRIDPVLFTVVPVRKVLYETMLAAIAMVVLSALLLGFELKTRWRALRVAGYVLGTAVCFARCFLLCEHLNGTMPWEFAPRYLALNLLLMSFVALILFALTFRLGLSVVVVNVIVTVLSVANHFTMMFRQIPVTVSDILALSTALDVAGSYEYEITGELVMVAAQVILTAAVAVQFLQLRLYRKGLAKRRLFAGAGCLAVGLCGVKVFADNQFHNRMGTQVQLWSPQQSCVELGYPLYLMSSYAATRLEKPEGYTVSRVTEEMAQYVSDEADGLYELPNIILIMNESLADFEAGGTLQTDTPVLPFLHSLSENGQAVTGSVVVPTFGAGTCNTEIESLAGVNYLFGLTSNPYFLYSYDGMPSVAQVAQQLGYETTAVHIKDAENWSRNIGFPAMGFQTFISEDNCLEYIPDEPVVVGWKATDAYSYEIVLDAMQRSKTRDFVFCVTIQNHGGYDHGYTSEEPVQILQPMGSYPQAEEYLNLAHDSDLAFQQLISVLEESDEPTIVMMFGDHLPSVETEFLSQVLNADDPFSWYKTPVVIWANFETDFAGLEEGFCTSSNYLSVLLTRAAGLPQTGWMKFLEQLRGSYPILSLFGVEDAQGTIFSAEALSGDELVAQYDRFQYRLLSSLKGAQEFFFLLPQESTADKF